MKKSLRILNIHGYQGAAENSAFAALRALGYDVVSLQLDYDAEDPESVLERLIETADVQKVDAVVGTSLGGFFAALLSARSSIPAILANPCLMPFVYLPRLGYTGDVRPYVRMFGELSELEPGKICTIVGGSDEVIDSHDFDRVLLGDERVTVIPEGKHSGATLPLKEYFRQTLGDIYENIERAQPGSVIGALIGLVGACGSNPKTPNTDSVVLKALALSKSIEPDALVEEITAEKYAVSPGCATCSSPCGNTSDYDVSRIYNAPEAVRDAKLRIIDSLHGLAENIYDSDNSELLFEKVSDTVYKALSYISYDLDEKHLLDLLAEIDNKKYCRCMQ